MEDPDPAYEAKIPQFCSFIDAGRQLGKVMVHCTGAVSRSPAVILAYLCHLDGSLERTVERLRKTVPTGIDESFLYQLAHAHGLELTATEVKALQQKLLGQSQRREGE